MKNLGKRILSTMLMLAMAISVLPGMSVTAAEGDYMLFSAEFDGKDDTAHWANFKSGGAFVSKSVCGEVKDGYLQTKNTNTGTGCWGATWEESKLSTKDAQGNYKKNVYFETKFKISAVPSGTHRICEFRGTAKNGSTDAAFFKLYVQDGCFAHGQGTAVTKTDYALSAETWYTIKSRFSFADKDRKTYTTITDENGTSASVETGFLWGSAFEEIKWMSMHQNDVGGTTYVTDYVRLYDADLLPPATVLYNGKDLSNQRISSNSFTANVTFPFDVTQADLNGITINNGASVSAVIGNNNKSATLSISSLADRGVYTLSIPAIGTNPAKEVKFIAANDSGYLFRAEFDGADDTTHWANFVSGGGFGSKTVCGEVKDGYLQTKNTNTGSGCWGATWEESRLSTKDAQGNYKSNVYFETKFKISAVPSGTHRICEFRGLAKASSSDAAFFRLSVQDGCFAHGNGSGVTKTDYALSAETWYTIKSRFSFADRKAYTTITDENGTSAPFETNFVFSSLIEDIKWMSMHQNDVGGTTYVTDYVRLYEEQEKTPVFSDSISPVANVETFDDASNTYSKAFNIEGLDWSLYKSIIVKSGDEVKGKSFTALGINNNISGEGSVGIIVNGLPQSNAAIRFTDKEIK